MTVNEIISLTEETLDEKMEVDDDFIKYSFYEIRVKHNLSEQDMDVFLNVIRNKLENNDYNVYFTGAFYNYNGKKNIVGDNEILVAIKIHNL